MPDIDGLDLQEQVARHGIQLAVIVMTGHGDVPIAVRAMKAGAVDFIEKPFSDDLILGSVARSRTRPGARRGGRDTPPARHLDGARARGARRHGRRSGEQGYRSRAGLNDLSQMGSTVAHELNQPLTAITNYLHAARRMVEAAGATATDRLASALDKAAAQALRAGTIIERLRRFVEKRDAPYAYQNVNEVVAEASQLALVGASRSGATLRAEFIPEPANAFIDKIQIQQVVLNLMRNAIDAMAQSPEKILSVATRRDGAFITITIADTGPG